ncbi:hypothetical protein IQ07DRAFT_82938 [Pyrenochaeta sp. DS3sAY3a]|nr:hypothetical protein IQ07DRAFT_82938 [Pyrenochaeta sp. DS3sAY3a]
MELAVYKSSTKSPGHVRVLLLKTISRTACSNDQRSRLPCELWTIMETWNGCRQVMPHGAIHAACPQWHVDSWALSSSSMAGSLNPSHNGFIEMLRRWCVGTESRQMVVASLLVVVPQKDVGVARASVICMCQHVRATHPERPSESCIYRCHTTFSRLERGS